MSVMRLHVRKNFSLELKNILRKFNVISLIKHFNSTGTRFGMFECQDASLEQQKRNLMMTLMNVTNPQSRSPKVYGL